MVDKGKSDERVLEVGCGGGNTYRFNPMCPHADVFLDIEMPSSSIDNFVLADAQHLPIKTKSCMRIYASHVIEHLVSPDKFLIECVRVLQSHGCVHIWTPNILSKTAKKDASHKHIFNFFTLRRLLRKNGLNSHWRYLVLSSYIPPKIRKIFNVIHSIVLEELFVEACTG